MHNYHFSAKMLDVSTFCPLHSARMKCAFFLLAASEHTFSFNHQIYFHLNNVFTNYKSKSIL
uniref:Uncharacterized protein n=1 Tax=Arundo donax TaxID=35708 RepID=A0A0A8YS03_ARUDO